MTTLRLPIGYRFLPTDDELILEYLQKKARGEVLPYKKAVRDLEIYGEDGKEPWKMFNKNKNTKFYVFTKLKKKGPARRVERRAGSGTRKGQRTDLVRDSQNNHLGFKKLFVFEVKGSAGIKNATDNGHWLMHEFSLTDQQCDYVLCEIRNKKATDTPDMEEDDECIGDEDMQNSSMAGAEPLYTSSALVVPASTQGVDMEEDNESIIEDMQNSWTASALIPAPTPAVDLDSALFFDEHVNLLFSDSEPFECTATHNQDMQNSLTTIAEPSYMSAPMPTPAPAVDMSLGFSDCDKLFSYSESFDCIFEELQNCLKKDAEPLQTSTPAPAAAPAASAPAVDLSSGLLPYCDPEILPISNAHPFSTTPTGFYGYFGQPPTSYFAKT